MRRGVALAASYGHAVVNAPHIQPVCGVRAGHRPGPVQLAVRQRERRLGYGPAQTAELAIAPEPAAGIVGGGPGWMAAPLAGGAGQAVADLKTNRKPFRLTHFEVELNPRIDAGANLFVGRGAVDSGASYPARGRTPQRSQGPVRTSTPVFLAQAVMVSW